MKKLILIFLIVLPIFLLLGISWFAGNALTNPVPVIVGNCPADFTCENIEFASESGSTIKGWFVQGEPGKGAVVVMHGLRSSRTQLVDRIRFLRKSGFWVMAFDFQGSGESIGERLTFGYLESRDATAALNLIKQKLPNERVGVLGISMGGAAFLLQNEPVKADSLILEMVYPTMQRAVDNRLNLWLFNGADNISFLMTSQFPLRLGVSINDLRPLDKVKDVTCPTLVIAAENDVHTTLEESRQLFDAANQPKDLWIVPKAEHTDLLKVAPDEYKQKVLTFFETTLRGERK